jgi:hypothetical protein
VLPQQLLRADLQRLSSMLRTEMRQMSSMLTTYRRSWGRYIARWNTLKTKKNNFSRGAIAGFASDRWLDYK